MSINVVIPAYKEAKNLQILLPKIHKVCQGMDYDVIIVDTNIPMDDTQQICSQYANTKYIRRTPQNFYGDAIRSAILELNKEYVIFMDGDGSHPAEYIKTLYDNRNNADVVVGSRYIDKTVNNNRNSLPLRIMSTALNKTYSIIFGIKCLDISTSFKLYRAAELQRLNLKSNNFNVIQEIIVKLRKNKKDLKILEIPSPFFKRNEGESKRNYFTFIISYVITIFRLKFDI